MFSICSICFAHFSAPTPTASPWAAEAEHGRVVQGAGNRVFTRTFVPRDPPSCKRQAHPWNLCRRKLGGDSVCEVYRWQPRLRSCLQTFAVCGRGSFVPGVKSSPPASLSSTDKGSEEGWLMLENELKAPVAPFHRNSPFILFI